MKKKIVAFTLAISTIFMCCAFTATGIGFEEEIPEVVEVVEGGIAFSADATATIYNAAGVAVAKQQGAGTVMLQPGVYVVSVGNKNLKVVVK